MYIKAEKVQIFLCNFAASYNSGYCNVSHSCGLVDMCIDYCIHLPQVDNMPKQFPRVVLKKDVLKNFLKIYWNTESESLFNKVFRPQAEAVNICRSSFPEVLCKKVAKFTGKHLYQRLFFPCGKKTAAFVCQEKLRLTLKRCANKVSSL